MNDFFFGSKVKQEPALSADPVPQRVDALSDSTGNHLHGSFNVPFDIHSTSPAFTANPPHPPSTEDDDLKLGCLKRVSTQAAYLSSAFGLTVPQPGPPMPAVSSNDMSKGVSSVVPADAIRHLLNEQSIKKKRLARKAELARLSRRRKKMKLTDLEEENGQLKRELQRLQALRQRDQELLLKYKQEQGAPRTEQGAPIHLHGSGARSAGQEVKDVQQFLLTMLEDIKNSIHTLETVSLATSQFTPLQLSFLQWIMSQKDSFYDDQSGLWTSLFGQELGCSPSQMLHLEQLRNRTKVVLASTVELEVLLEQLKMLIRSKIAAQGANLEDLATVLLPEQLASLCTWIQRFGNVCIKIKV